MTEGSKAIRNRLYVPGRFLGYQRNKVKQRMQVHLIKISGVESRAETEWYLGKKVLFAYKAETEKNGTRNRAVWGKICKAHGNNGVVRARFKSNLPSAAMGKPVQVMMYPSKI